MNVKIVKIVEPELDSHPSRVFHWELDGKPYCTIVDRDDKRLLRLAGAIGRKIVDASELTTVSL